MSTSATSGTNPRPEFVTLIAIYQFVTAGILLLLSCLIPAALFPFVIFNIDQSEGVFAGLVIGTAALALFLGFAFASTVVGWGLMRMREWARLGAIVLAAFALIGFPIWTIVAILVLVYMTGDEARYAFHPEEAPPEILARTVSTADPDLAPQAAYKADPPGQVRPSPTDETRPAGIPASESATNGSPTGVPPSQETRRIDTVIPMPPPQDPSEATESFYDQEGDVSDHYRRWKASLPREPADVGETAAVPVQEPEAGEADHERWKPPAPLAAQVAEEQEVDAASGEVSATPTEEASIDQPLTTEEAGISERIWGPSWAFERAASEDEDSQDAEADDVDEKDPDATVRAVVDPVEPPPEKPGVEPSTRGEPEPQREEPDDPKADEETEERRRT